LSEASTWGGISAFAAAMVTQVPASVQPYMLGLSGAAAALAVVIAEKGSSRTPAQIAADALAAAQEADRLRS
jgi:hypothetical protein